MTAVCVRSLAHHRTPAICNPSTVCHIYRYCHIYRSRKACRTNGISFSHGQSLVDLQTTTPSIVDEIDVLVTFVLAIQAWTGSDSSNEILVHVRGCVSMFQALAPISRLLDILKTFGPLIFDYLTLLEFQEFDPRETFQAQCIAFGQGSYFRQRPKYISAIRIDCEGTEWNSEVGWAIHTTAMFLFDMAFCIFMRMVSPLEYLEEGLRVDYSQIVEVQFCDSALPGAMRSAGHWKQKGPIRYSLIHSPLMRNRTLLKLELVPLLLSILQETSILPGTNSPETIAIARGIIRTY
jgi:hypothetical protein